jgi:hypothetical protein
MSSRSPTECYAFDITVHGHPQGDLAAGTPHEDLGVTWPTVAVPRDCLSVPMAVDFDGMLTRLGSLERMYVEPDGALVWTSPRDAARWQVDGNAYEKEGRVLLVDLKGSCPPGEFDRLLGCLDWPRQRVLIQLVRPAVFLDESTFRRHALARGLAGDGETLRPR